MDRSQKAKLVEELTAHLKEAEVVIVTRQGGLTVEESSDLRRRVRGVGAGYKVAKNRLAQRALKGTRYEGLSALFKGPTALAYAADPVATAKAIMGFANSNEKLTVLGGAMGETVLNAESVKQLASLPSLDELRAKLVGMLQTPATRIATVLQAPASQLARVLSAYAKKDA
jgi:large subunit ribosomal protein L10